MLDFERKYNKEREDDNKRVVCFACHKEGHTIQNCFKLFPHLKNKDGEGKQDRRSRQKKDGYKGKQKAKAMQALWSADSDETGDDESDFFHLHCLSLFLCLAASFALFLCLAPTSSIVLVLCNSFVIVLVLSSHFWHCSRD